MGTTQRGRKRQQAQYRKVQKELNRRYKLNARRRKDKRKKLNQIRVAIGDPMAPFGLDKEKTYRPLYNVQTMTDVDTDFVLAFSVTATLSDSGHMVPMIDLTNEVTGRPLKTLLADSGYPTGEDLARCRDRTVEVFAPWNENSFTLKKRANAGANRPIRKDEFTWDPEIEGYRCPQGKPLTYQERSSKQRANGDSIPLDIYSADPADCAACPLKARCVHGSSGARTVRRQPHEDLIDQMRDRMKTPEGKALYRKRSSTVERRYADWRNHRALDRISGRTPEAAETQVALTILAHNLVLLHKLRSQREETCGNEQKQAA
jgi:hypothetical protein